MQNRRSSFNSSTASSLAKRHATSSSSSDRKAVDLPPDALGKKRVPMGNLTNHRIDRNVAEANCKTKLGHSTLLPNGMKIAKTRKSSSPSTSGTGGFMAAQTLPRFSNSKSSEVVQSKNTSFRRVEEGAVPAVPNRCSSTTMVMFSPARSDDHSVSVDDTMSTCDSFKSPDVEYIDNADVSGIHSVDRKTFSNLFISDHEEKTVNICNRDAVVDTCTDVKMVDIDDNDMDPQLCATIACDIYKHLRASEMKKRPSTDFMGKIQKDINESMRAILIDWLVEVAEEYRLVPETLYLTVNYVDRYLSGNAMNRQRLQLLGVASMMIASKYEEICAPQVEEFCYITDNTYFKEEVLQMESAVLNYLKFELTAPTPKCFLRRFARVAQADNSLEVPSMQLECLANYIAELSLLEYSMLQYAPSLVAASAVFLAKFILAPSKRPWDPTLQHYTQYQPPDLSDCVKDLHRLCCLNSQDSNLPAVREKYSQHKYKYVAKKHCPPSIPREYFNSI